VIFGKQRCGKSEKAISWHQTGPQGLQGNPGAQGPHGNAGATGPSPGPLPTGKTLRGNYNMGGTAAVAGALANTAISFIFQFVSAPNFNYIAPGGSSTAACPGSAASRSATPGNLCVYSQGVLNNRRPEQQHRPMGGYAVRERDGRRRVLRLRRVGGDLTVAPPSGVVGRPRREGGRHAWDAGCSMCSRIVRARARRRMGSACGAPSRRPLATDRIRFSDHASCEVASPICRWEPCAPLSAATTPPGPPGQESIPTPTKTPPSRD
jgi:hypothetical protein